MQVLPGGVPQPEKAALVFSGPEELLAGTAGRCDSCWSGQAVRLQAGSPADNTAPRPRCRSGKAKLFSALRLNGYCILCRDE